MSKTNDTVEAQPTFDLSRVSRKWGKRWAALMHEVTDIQADSMEAEPPEPDSKIADAEARTKAQQRAMSVFMRAGEKRVGRMREIAAEQEQMLAQVLTDVPREWLTSDAPKSIDWSDSESLDWLQESRYPLLIQALNAARQGNRTA